MWQMLQPWGGALPFDGMRGDGYDLCDPAGIHAARCAAFATGGGVGARQRAFSHGCSKGTSHQFLFHPAGAVFHVASTCGLGGSGLDACSDEVPLSPGSGGVRGDRDFFLANWQPSSRPFWEDGGRIGA